MASGTVTLNGISDADLIVILQIKERFPREITFDPQTLRAARTSPGAAQHYSEATLAWTGPGGLEGLIEVLKHVRGKMPAPRREQAVPA